MTDIDFDVPTDDASIRAYQIAHGIICPIPQEQWADPQHGVIVRYGALKLVDALGYFVITDNGDCYEEHDFWREAIERFTVLAAGY